MRSSSANRNRAIMGHFTYLRIKADHPDQKNYPGQRIYFVVVETYIYLVPHVVENDYVFMKTIIPSRKATKAYQKEQEDLEHEV